MNRRDTVLALLGLGAAALAPGRATTAAQSQAMPVIGYLNGASAAQFPHLLAAFRKGLGEAGYREGQNVTIEYRYADGDYDRLPMLAADLVGRRVALIVATAGTPTIRAAKAATSTIPIVFVIGGDPVRLGLVAGLNRPGNNVTGATLVATETVAKRLQLLLELVPAAATIGVLANPDNPITALQLEELRTAVHALGRQIRVFGASTDKGLESALAAAGRQHVDALLVAADPFFDDRRAQVVALAARQRLPASYVRGDYVAAGGLMSYGPDVDEAFRQAGLYAGRILKGEKPADLPVLRPTRFELAINLRTAKALGITVPRSILLLADHIVD